MLRYPFFKALLGRITINRCNHRRPKLTIREIDRINDLCKRMNDLCKRMSDLCKRIEWDVTTCGARRCVTI